MVHASRSYQYATYEELGILECFSKKLTVCSSSMIWRSCGPIRSAPHATYPLPVTLTVVEGPWVLGGIERGTNWCFLTSCPGNPRYELTLLRLIQQFVLPGTTIIADGWKSDISLGLHEYIYTVVNHSDDLTTLLLEVGIISTIVPTLPIFVLVVPSSVIRSSILLKNRRTVFSARLACSAAVFMKFSFEKYARFLRNSPFVTQLCCMTLPTQGE